MVTGPKKSRTPILDLQRPVPNRRMERLWSSGFLFAIGLFIVCPLFKLFYPPILVVSAFLTIFVATAVHEFGHLLFGAFVGWKFAGVTFGPFVWESIPRKIFRIRPSLLGGNTLMYPDRIRCIRKRLIVFILGGPLCNLASASVAAFAFWYLFPTSYLLTPLALFALISGWMGISSLIPAKASAPENDGRQLWSLLNSRTQARYYVASYGLSTLRAQRVPLHRWKGTWLASAIRSKPSLQSDYAKIVRYSRACTAPEIALALENGLSKCMEYAPLYRDALFADASFFQAWFRDDPQKAQQWLGRCHDSEQTLMLLRAEVAISCALRKYDEAKTKIEESLNILRLVSNDGTYESWVAWGEQIGDMKRAFDDGQDVAAIVGDYQCRCPECMWLARKRHRWQCNCGHSWNTFETEGLCPNCGHRWTSTQCLNCGEWSEFSQWLHSPKSPEEQSCPA